MGGASGSLVRALLATNASVMASQSCGATAEAVMSGDEAASGGAATTVGCGASTFARFFGGADEAAIATATGEEMALTTTGEAIIGAATPAREEEPTARATDDVTAAPMPTLGSCSAPITDTWSCGDERRTEEKANART